MADAALPVRRGGFVRHQTGTMSGTAVAFLSHSMATVALAPLNIRQLSVARGVATGKGTVKD